SSGVGNIIASTLHNQSIKRSAFQSSIRLKLVQVFSVTLCRIRIIPFRLAAAPRYSVIRRCWWILALERWLFLYARQLLHYAVFVSMTPARRRITRLQSHWILL